MVLSLFLIFAHKSNSIQFKNIIACSYLFTLVFSEYNRTKNDTTVMHSFLIDQKNDRVK